MRDRQFWFIGTRNYWGSHRYSYRILRKYGGAGRLSALAEVSREVLIDAWGIAGWLIVCRVLGHRPIFKMYDAWCARCSVPIERRKRETANVKAPW